MSNSMSPIPCVSLVPLQAYAYIFTTQNLLKRLSNFVDYHYNCTYFVVVKVLSKRTISHLYKTVKLG